MNPPAPVTSTDLPWRVAATARQLIRASSGGRGSYGSGVAWSVPLADIQLRDDELAAVVDTYRSGWLSMGPRTEEFEAAFRDYCRAGNAIAVANGTAALHLSCMAVGLGADDEVVVPSLTFVATANAVAYTGARPVFADIAALDRPWLSAETVERAITPRTRAVMTMAYGGHPGEIEALRDL